MSHSDLLVLIVAIVLVPLAGVLAAVDSALAWVSPARVEEYVREGRRGAVTLAQLLSDSTRYTNLLLLLRMTCEITATVLVTIAARSIFGGRWWVTVATVAVMVVATYVLVGVGPRTLGRQHPYSVALPTAGIVRLLGRLFGPLSSLLIVIGNAVTPGRGFREGPFGTTVELREMVDMAESSGVVEHDERQMIQSVFELGDTIAREVMVPRTEIVFIDSGAMVPQALTLALRSGFSRIPVISENLDDIVGIAYLKDLTRRAQDPEQARRTSVSEVMRPAVYVPESKPVDELLREMQVHRTHMAVVIDEYGGTAGLISIEDILEEIVGEIADEYDNERPAVERIDEDTVRVIARMAVEDLGALFDVEMPDRDDVETVGGLLADSLGMVPIPGASAVVNGLELTAENVTGRRNRVDTVVVRRLPTKEGEEDEATNGESRGSEKGARSGAERSGRSGSEKSARRAQEKLTANAGVAGERGERA